MSDECTNCVQLQHDSTVVAVCAFIRSADQLGTLLAAVQDMWLLKLALFS